MPDNQSNFNESKSKLNAAQLQALGIQQIEIDAACTVENNADFFSHRTEKGVTGRMLALIGFQVA